jgi:hypothetical protein
MLPLHPARIENLGRFPHWHGDGTPAELQPNRGNYIVCPSV